MKSHEPKWIQWFQNVLSNHCCQRRESWPQKTLRSTLFSKYLPWKLHSEWKPFSKLVRGFRYAKRFISSQSRMCGCSSWPSCVTSKNVLPTPSPGSPRTSLSLVAFPRSCQWRSQLLLQEEFCMMQTWWDHVGREDYLSGWTKTNQNKNLHERSGILTLL